MEKDFNEREALQLIEEMIAQAKKDFRESGFDLILWGWLMMAASLSHYIIEQFDSPVPSYVGWIVFSIMGGILSGRHHKKQNREMKAVSYAGQSINHVWAGFGLSLFVALFTTIARSPFAIFPMSLCLMGYGTYVTGRITKFKWLVYGAFASWILALISFNMSYDSQILMYALGLLLSYIIPGYLLNNEYKQHQQARPMIS